MNQSNDEKCLELERLGSRRDELIALPWSTEASREVERIDGEMEAIWAALEQEAKSDAE